MRRLALAGALLAVVGAIAYFESLRPPRPVGGSAVSVTPSTSSPATLEKTQRYEPAKEIVNPAGFINTDSVKIADLVGKKAVLVDFWTYSCINCQRTLPYLNAWYDKYRHQGLEIIGVHTPEFEFEQRLENVQAAVDKYDIRYPVVLDNNYTTWRAYENRYWPRKYLIDIDGFIVYDHIGEGAYEETEQKIQELLHERLTRLKENGEVAGGVVTPAGASGADFSKVGSPEIYFGAARNRNFGNGTTEQVGTQTLTLPSTLELNKLYLSSSWKFTDEYAENLSVGSKIVFRYQAQDVYFVASAAEPVRLTIRRDGQSLGPVAGEDAPDGSATVQGDRLYKLVHDPAGYGEHTLEITIEESGLKAFTFTFG